MIDVDDAATWPTEVLAWVDEHTVELCGSTEFTADLRIDDEEDLRRLVGSQLVRAYHCTRLLDHERRVILDQGLRRLGPDLVNERIRRAHEVGAISDAERDAFESGNQFADPAWSFRAPITEGQVCLILSRQIFDESPNGCEPLLSIWGGEAIYFPLENRHRERLHSLGRPSIVVAAIDFSVTPADQHECCPSLANCMVGMRLGFSDLGADVFFRAPVPPENIDAIWQPGDAPYDRHRRLPRS
ncbi:MAG: hypothetical protein M0R80_17065 [Proteobacteria bacterium]|nr:hypothetical protein [Pseudomonadota bacterium]